MDEDSIAGDDLGELVEVMRDAASAYIGGNVRRYFELMKHADDFTLMGPFGGDVSRESGSSEASMVEQERFFQGGEATWTSSKHTHRATSPSSSSSSVSAARWVTVPHRTGH